MRLGSAASALLGVALATAGTAYAQTAMQDLSSVVSDSDGYGLMAFGNATITDGFEFHSGVAVGGTYSDTGNVEINANDVSYGSNPAFYVGGNISLSGSQGDVESGTAYLPGVTQSQWTWSSSNHELSLNSNPSSDYIQMEGGQTSNPMTTGSAPSGFSTAQSKLETLAGDFTTIGGNPTSYGAVAGTISETNGYLSFSSSATSGVVVFNLDAADFSGSDYNGESIQNGVELNFNTGVNYVINVTGLTNSDSSFTLLNGLNFVSGSGTASLEQAGAETLWNFGDTDDTTNITLGSTNFYGTILAPEETITDSTQAYGQVITDNFAATCDQELETDALVVTPEAGTFAWWALGLCAVGIAFRFRQPRGASA